MSAIRRASVLTSIVIGAILCNVHVANAQSTTTYADNTRIVQSWANGWDTALNTPSITYNSARSNIVWSYNNATKSLNASFYLSGATPGYQYAVGIAFFNCTGTMPNFGQFKAMQWGCGSNTRQGVTRNLQTIDIGVIQIDNNGNGTLDVDIKGISTASFNASPSRYNIGFYIRKGVGCINAPQNVSSQCPMALQSGGIFGTNYAIQAN